MDANLALILTAQNNASSVISSVGTSLSTLRTQVDNVNTSFSRASGQITSGFQAAQLGAGYVDAEFRVLNDTMGAGGSGGGGGGGTIGGLLGAGGAAESAGNQMQAAAGKAVNLRGAFSELRSSSLALELLGGAIAAPGIAAIKTASDFQSSMARIAGFTSLPTADVDTLRQGILNLSKVIPQSPDELGAAAYQVLSRNISDVNLALDITKIAGQDAAAGLGKASDIAGLLTSIISVYPPGAYSAAQANDILVQSAKSGAGELDQFYGSIGRVIGVAAEMGVSLQEVGANIAVLTNAGMSADEATTALRQILQEMIKPSVQAQTELANIGKAAGITGLNFDQLRQSIKDKGLLSTLEDLFKLTADGVKSTKDVSTAVASATQAVTDAQEKLKPAADRVTIAQETQRKAAEALTKAQAAANISIGQSAKQDAAAAAAKLKVTNAYDALQKANYSLEQAQAAQSNAAENVAKAQGKVNTASAKGVTTQQDQIEALGKLFPNVRGLVGLLNSVGTQQESYNKILDATNNSWGVGDAAVKPFINTLNYQFKLAVSNLKVAFIEFGDQVIPVITKIIAKGTELIKWFDGLSPTVKEALVVISLLGGGLLIAAGAIAFVIGSLGLLALAVAALGIPFAAAVGIIIIVPILLTAIAVAAYFLITRWDEVKAKTLEVWNSLPEPLKVFLRFMEGEVMDRVKSFVKIFTSTFDVIKDLINIIKDVWHADWNKLWDDVKQLASDSATAIVNTINTVFGGLPNDLYKIGKDAGTKLLKGIGEIAGDALGKIGLGGLASGLGLPGTGGTNTVNGIGTGSSSDSSSAPSGPGYTTYTGGGPSSAFSGRASGGPVAGGTPYMVGENGPELFIPRSSGDIMPHGSGMGDMHIQQLTIVANDPEDFFRKLQEYQSRQLKLARRAS